MGGCHGYSGGAALCPGSYCICFHEDETVNGVLCLYLATLRAVAVGAPQSLTTQSCVSVADLCSVVATHDGIGRPILEARVRAQASSRGSCCAGQVTLEQLLPCQCNSTAVPYPLRVCHVPEGRGQSRPQAYSMAAASRNGLNDVSIKLNKNFSKCLMPHKNRCFLCITFLKQDAMNEACSTHMRVTAENKI